MAKRNRRFSSRNAFDELRRGRFLASEKSTMVIDLNDLEAITRPPPVFLPLLEERREIVVVFAHSESSITRLVTQRCTRTSSSVNLSSSCRVCRQTKLSMFPIESPSDRRQRPHVRVYHRSDNFRFDDRTRDIVLVRFTPAQSHHSRDPSFGSVGLGILYVRFACIWRNDQRRGKYRTSNKLLTS